MHILNKIQYLLTMFVFLDDYWLTSNESEWILLMSQSQSYFFVHLICICIIHLYIYLIFLLNTHYRISHAPNKRYLAPDITINDMYQSFCTNEEKNLYSTFLRIFKKMNIYRF